MTYKFIEIFMGVCATNILIGTFILMFITKYFVPYDLWHKFDKFMHTKLIVLPICVKCCLKLNKDDKYCYNEQAINTWESQQNGDIDFYTVCHLILWAIIGHYCNISYFRVFIFSLVWEIFESVAGYFDYPCHARTLDIFINMLGFYIGKL